MPSRHRLRLILPALLVAFYFASSLPAQKGFGPRVQYFHENVPGVQDDARDSEFFGSSLASGDFNQDGLDDLVIGVSAAQSGSVLAAGAVHVLYGRSGTGLYPLGQYWDQSLICGEAVEAGDQFGFAVAVGDFDGDGVDDLAIGAPGDGVGGAAQAGLVQVIFGVARVGLSNGRCQKWHQDRPGVEGDAETGDRFGAALAAGDFNGDGVDDLAVGVPSEGLPGAATAGSVQVFPGQWGTGLVTTGALWLKEGATIDGYPLTGIPAAGELFGSALAAGDFNHDGADDLAIGIPQEAGSGAVAVVMGRWGIGLSGRKTQFWTQDSPNVGDTSDWQDLFGTSLAVGDWNGDGFDDLAIGSPGESMGFANYAGAVHLLTGSIFGLTSGGAFFTEDTETIPGVGESGDNFGHALASGDFDGDGVADLAIGAPGKRVLVAGRGFRSGMVHVLTGSPAGITTDNHRAWSQESAGVGGEARSLAFFGYALAGGDFDGDGTADLAIGAPLDDPGILDAGSVNVLLDLDEGPTPPPNL